MNIERIDGGAARRVHGVEELRELHEIARILQRAGPSPAVEVGAVGRPAHRREGDPLAADADVVGGVARMEGEFGGRRLQRLLDDVAPDPHPLAIDPRTRLLQDVARLGQQHVHADLFQHLQRLAVDGLDLVIGEDARGFQRCCGCCQGSCWIGVWAASARRPRRCTFMRQSPQRPPRSPRQPAHCS